MSTCLLERNQQCLRTETDRIIGGPYERKKKWKKTEEFLFLFLIAVKSTALISHSSFNRRKAIKAPQDFFLRVLVLTLQLRLSGPLIASVFVLQKSGFHVWLHTTSMTTVWGADFISVPHQMDLY